MQLYGALVLLVTLSAACGLKCYACTLRITKSCTDISTCPAFVDRCFSLNVNGFTITKGCLISNLCGSGMHCCEGDLCNGAISTGSSVLLLLVSSAVTTVFL